MSSFETLKQKLYFSWKLAEKNKNSITNRIFLDKKLTEKLNLSQKRLDSFNNILDFSTGWLRPDFIETDTDSGFNINYELVFEKINIKFIPYLQGHFSYYIGNEDGILINEEVHDIVLEETNEIVQILDIPNLESPLIKKVIWSKSLFLPDSTFTSQIQDTDFKIQLFLQLYNPIKFI